MIKIGKIFLIAVMVSAIAAQPLLCQTKNRISCAFSSLCQWSTNGNCVELEVNQIVPCHNFTNSEECGEYSTCTWNALNSTCNINNCDQVDKFYMCHSYRECQWTDGVGCQNRTEQQLQVNQIVPCHNFTNSEECGENSTCTWNALNSTCNINNCDQVDKFYMCHSYRECQWTDGVGCQNRAQQ